MNDRSDPRPGDMVQVHLLTAYPAALLNRDDQGLAKRITFGGAPRIRVSSQCLKKHWRDAEAIRSLGDQADRSIRVFEERVAKKLQTDHGVSEDAARAVAAHLMSKTVDTEVDTDKYKEGQVYAKQLLVLTRAETEWLAELGAEILGRVKAAGGNPTDPKALEDAFAPNKDKALRKDLETRLQALPASVDTAMFGRMVTSDLFARVDAAVGVAHAFTTHQGMGEPDYFTAVDTLKGDEDDAGAGLIQETELTSGVFYVYAVIDMNQLRKNLGGGADRAEGMARALVHTMTTVSPGAKRGSTAPYARAEFVLLERGAEQPRSLANAFLTPVADYGENNGAGTMERSVETLATYRAELEQEMYGAFEGKVAVSTIHRGPAKRLEAEPVALDAALDRIFGSGA
jgi:CRISPR system Cascade subunit CasC